jgi:hypothetical protein
VRGERGGIVLAKDPKKKKGVSRLLLWASAALGEIFSLFSAYSAALRDILFSPLREILCSLLCNTSVTMLK